MGLAGAGRAGERSRSWPDIQDSIQKEGPYSNLKVAGSNPAGVFFLLPRLKQERKNSFLTLHRSEIFPHWSGNNRSELFPFLFLINIHKHKHLSTIIVVSHQVIIKKRHFALISVIPPDMTANLKRCCAILYHFTNFKKMQIQHVMRENMLALESAVQVHGSVKSTC